MTKSRAVLFAAAFLLAAMSGAQADDLEAGRIAYENGDYETALAKWTPLAEQGDARALNNLALMYSNGQGVVADPKQAVGLFEEAAKQGNTAAQRNLGQLYESGDGVARDPVTANMWYNIGSASGDRRAEFQRSQLESSMNTVERLESERRAFEWMEKNYPANRIDYDYFNRRRNQ